MPEFRQRFGSAEDALVLIQSLTARDIPYEQEETVLPPGEIWPVISWLDLSGGVNDTTSPVFEIIWTSDKPEYQQRVDAPPRRRGRKTPET